MKLHHLAVGYLGTNCYILETNQKNALIIDPGDEAGRIQALLEENALTPKYILLTHGHGDHTGGIEELKRAYPDVKVYVSRNELELLAQPRYAFAQKAVGSDHLLDDGDEVDMDDVHIQVIATPGHSKGSVCFLAEDMLFSGDTLFAGDCGRCDLFGGDFGQMKASLKRLAALPGDYTVYPGHGPSSRLSYEREHNPYIEG